MAVDSFKKKAGFSLKIWSSVIAQLAMISFLYWRGYWSLRTPMDLFGELFLISFLVASSIRSIWTGTFSLVYLFFPANLLLGPWASVEEFRSLFPPKRLPGILGKALFNAGSGILKLFAIGFAMEFALSGVFYNLGSYSIESIIFALVFVTIQAYFLFCGAVDCSRGICLLLATGDPYSEFPVNGFGYWHKLKKKSIAGFFALGVFVHWRGFQSFHEVFATTGFRGHIFVEELFPRETLIAQNLLKGLILAALLILLRRLKARRLIDGMFLFIIAIILASFPKAMLHSLNYFSFF